LYSLEIEVVSCSLSRTRCSITRANRPFHDRVDGGKRMKIGAKMLIAAIFSLLIGVAFASPLLLSDLNIRPWITHVQGPTAEFKVEVAYANFTVDNNDSIAYQIVLNITNSADIGARLLDVNFVAAEKITNITGQNPFGGSGNWTTGSGWEAEGAWVDGKWYNLTWVNGAYPFFDNNGNMVPTPFEGPNIPGYWMEGV
jgi:hypothetical protein